MHTLILLFLLYNFVNAADPDLTLKATTIDRPITGTSKNIKLRYLSNNAFSSSSSSPLLIHLTFGNDVTEVANEQKFIFSIAQQLKASVHFVEHRYFGESKVNSADVYTSGDNFTEFTAAAALEDFKAVIKTVRTDSQKVILSGAGYAGQLAAILQMQDSENIVGSIISNAPLYLHQGGGVELGAFDNQLNKVYENEGCPMDKLKAAFDAINGMKDAVEANKIVDAFKLNDDGDGLFDNQKTLQFYLHRAYAGLVYQNFDRNSSLSANQMFEARPVKKYCDGVSKLPTGTEIEKVIAPLQLLIETFYQKSDLNTKEKHAYNDFKIGSDIRKSYVECTSNVPYHCSIGGANDYFKQVCTDDTDATNWLKSFKETCSKLVSDFDKSDMKENTFKELTGFKFTDLKNVIYINGENDPNQVGAVSTVDNAKSQYKFLIPGATKSAHLLPPTTCDPDNIKEVRYRVIDILNCWINADTSSNCAPSQFTGTLSVYAATSATTCEDQLLAYPWGQTRGSGGGTVPTKSPSRESTTYSSAPSSMQLLIQLPLLSLIFALIL